MSGTLRFSPGSVRYDHSLAARYVDGRSLSDSAAETWRAAIAPYSAPASSWTVLDLGAGTGRFSCVWASFAGARVIAVEPSRDMLAAAVQHGTGRAVRYVAGAGERIPLRDASCDLAWLSHVFHHLRDRLRCVRELRRVLCPGCRVLVRGAFGDRLDGYPTLFRFFPGARRLCAGLPTIVETMMVFAEEQFTLEAHRQVQQQTCGTLREFAERTRRRADSCLMLLPDEEFHAGLVALDAAARDDDRGPVVESVDLLVFRASGEAGRSGATSGPTNPLHDRGPHL